MSFQFGGQVFTPKEYYRDDTLALDVLRASLRNPVLVMGLRRIGKSWFLRRLSQILERGKSRHFIKGRLPQERTLGADLPTRVHLFEGHDEASRAELRELLVRGDTNTLVAIDEFESVAEDAALVTAVLGHRGPLVLAAAPIIHERAQESSALLTFFHDRCAHQVLRPLAEIERRALIRQRCDPDDAARVPQAYQALALGKEWGGHPMVLQQICTVIRHEGLTEPQDVHDRAYARLNEGAQYGRSLVDRGLTQAQREALFQVASGEEPIDTNAARELHAHGAIIRGDAGRWEIENRLLAQYLRATPAQPRAALPIRTKHIEPAKPRFVFTWVHLSDLHFGAGNRERHFDRKKVTRAIVRDLQAYAPRSVDRIFVTGDVAFSAKPDEYREAKSWLDEVAKAAGISLGQLRLVPGNHDVDRQLARKPLVRTAHRAVRYKLTDLDDLFADTDARAALAEKLGAYRSFVKDDIADHPPSLDSSGIDWVEPLAEITGVRGPIRIAGLSTVWISDEEDGTRESSFVPNMVLPLASIESTIHAAKDHEVVLVLTHHPPHWLDAASAQALKSALARPTHVHLCGHVHDAAASAETRVGLTGRSVRWVAGAAHGDKGEEYSYAWGALRYDPANTRWQAGWAPRLYEPNRDAMRADTTRYDLDEAGFAWADIECLWPAPTA